MDRVSEDQARENGEATEAAVNIEPNDLASMKDPTLPHSPKKQSPKSIKSPEFNGPGSKLSKHHSVKKEDPPTDLRKSTARKNSVGSRSSLKSKQSSQKPPVADDLVDTVRKSKELGQTLKST